MAGGVSALAIGFSGGGDSRALLAIAARWARQKSVALHAFIVDHALRPESASEALAALAAAKDEGVEARILTRQGDKPQSGLQAAARLARHQLLSQACREAGINHLLLAHNRDDQDETVWMRLASKSGWRGCAGMREVGLSPVWPEGRELVLLRPCLDITRAELRDYLRDRQIAWLDDPSNNSEHFTRVRVRKTISAHIDAGFAPERFSAWAGQLRDIDHGLTLAAGLRARDCVRLHSWGGARLEVQPFLAIQPHIRQRLLDAVMAAVAGARDVSRSAVRRLDRAIREGRSATAGGVMCAAWQGAIWLFADPGRVSGRVDQPGVSLRPVAGVIDGRFEVSTLTGWEIGPLGTQYDDLPGTVLQKVPGRARSGLLAFRSQGHILALAGLVRHPGLGCRPLFAQRFMHRLFAGQDPAWFDISAVLVDCESEL